jgi:hypothetical protein
MSNIMFEFDDTFTEVDERVFDQYGSIIYPHGIFYKDAARACYFINYKYYWILCSYKDSTPTYVYNHTNLNAWVNIKKDLENGLLINFTKYIYKHIKFE